MSKRFIDTELFDDPWFMDLSKDAKILWVYLITKCNHAGIIDINRKLIGVQTGIKSYETVSKQFNNRLIHLRDSYYFIPKFIEFQYPDFPRSNVQQQKGAIRILESFGLFTDGKLTVSKDLVKTYGNGNDTVIDNDNVDLKVKFADFVSLFPTEYEKLMNEHGQMETEKMIKILDNYKGSKGKQYKSDYRAILSWVVDKFYEKYPKPRVQSINEFLGGAEKTPERVKMYNSYVEKKLSDYHKQLS